MRDVRLPEFLIQRLGIDDLTDPIRGHRAAAPAEREGHGTSPHNIAR